MATTGNEIGQGNGMGNEGAGRNEGAMGDQSQTLGRTGQRAGQADDLREGIDRLGDAASSTVDRIAGEAQQTVDRVADSASEYAERFSAKGEQVMEEARDYIAGNPLRSIGIAAAAGFLIARIMR